MESGLLQIDTLIDGRISFVSKIDCSPKSWKHDNNCCFIAQNNEDNILIFESFKNLEIFLKIFEIPVQSTKSVGNTMIYIYGLNDKRTNLFHIIQRDPRELLLPHLESVDFNVILNMLK